MEYRGKNFSYSISLLVPEREFLGDEFRAKCVTVSEECLPFLRSPKDFVDGARQSMNSGNTG